MKKDGLGWVSGLLGEQDGQDVIEYALVVAVIGIGAIVCLNGLSSILSWLAYIGAWVMNIMTS